MKKRITLFSLLIAFSVLLLPAAYAEEVCSQSVHDLVASCPGGTLLADDALGSCRSLVCEDGTGADLAILACDKPGTPAEFFEMYQLTSGFPDVEACLGETCLDPSVSGFVKSEDFTCDEPATCQITSVHDMEYTCILTYSGEECPETSPTGGDWWNAEQYVNDEGNNCVDFSDHAVNPHSSWLLVTVCDDPELPGSFVAEVTSASMPPAAAAPPGHRYCLDGQCIDEEDFGYTFPLAYCAGDEVCGDGIVEGQEQCDYASPTDGERCNAFCRYDTSYFKVVDTFFKNTETDETIYFEDGDTVYLPQSDMTGWILGATLENHENFARDAYDNAIAEARYYAGKEWQIYKYDYGSGYINEVIEIVLETVTDGEAQIDLRGRAGGSNIVFFDIVISEESDVCIQSVFDTEVSCDGTITEDVNAGGCRKASCELGEDAFTVLACDKPVSENPEYFEMYNTAVTGSPNFELCFGEACMNPALTGFVRSEDFVACQQPEPVCGNNIVENGEACDDGNTESGDGCSAVCEEEACYDSITELPFHGICQLNMQHEVVLGEQTCVEMHCSNGFGATAWTISGLACDNEDNTYTYVFTDEVLSPFVDFDGDASFVPMCLGEDCFDLLDYYDEVDDPNFPPGFVTDFVYNGEEFVGSLCTDYQAVCGNGVWELPYEECDGSDTKVPSNGLVCNSECKLVEPVEEVCHESVQDVSVSCSSGEVTSDVWNGCRTVTCTDGEDFNTAKACDKPDSSDAEFFEIYQVARNTNTLEVCFGDSCISEHGYVRGADFPVCEEV